ISNLIQIYNENFSFWNTAKSMVRENKLILLPVILIFSSALYFYIISITNQMPFRNIQMIVSIVIFICSTLFGGYIRKTIIQRKYGGAEGLERYKLFKIETRIKEKLHIENLNEFSLLNTLVQKEIDKIENNNNFPLMNIIKQLFIAVLVTGLLAYSFKELGNGNTELALALLTIYIMIIGSLIFLSSILYITREYTTLYKLRQISQIIIEIQLNISTSQKHKTEA